MVHSKLVLEGYSISDNSALSMLQPYELRKALITYYVKAVIFYAITNPRLDKWLNNELVKEALEPLAKDKNFVDLDPTFNLSVDEDFCFNKSGITRQSFCAVYQNWIRYCLDMNQRHQDQHTTMTVLTGQQSSRRSSSKNSDHHQNEQDVITLCFALSLLARRALSAASHG